MKLKLISPVILLISIFGCSGVRSVAPDSAVSQEANNWDLQYSPGMPSHPFPANTGGWYFYFPNTPGSVHYVDVPYTQTTAHQSITMKFEIVTTGVPAFDSLDTGCGGYPAHVRLYFQRQNDDMVTDGYRWWSNPVSYQLGSSDNSVVTLTVSVSPDKWSGLYGEFGSDTPQAFQDAWQNVGRVGMTFGGGCSFGHGVSADGSAEFVLMSYTIQ
jgi:hypothetical protein